MQFNSKVSIVQNTYNDSGEEVAGQTDTVKCAVVKQSRTIANDQIKQSRTMGVIQADTYKKYVVQLITPFRDFKPINELLTNEKLTAIFEGVGYDISNIDPIRSGSGKIKFFMINLTEKKK